MKPPSFRRTALKENNISIIGMKDLAPGPNGLWCRIKGLNSVMQQDNALCLLFSSLIDQLKHLVHVALHVTLKNMHARCLAFC